jgi:hypothetical protein
MRRASCRAERSGAGLEQAKKLPPTFQNLAPMPDRKVANLEKLAGQGPRANHPGLRGSGACPYGDNGQMVRGTAEASPLLQRSVSE